MTAKRNFKRLVRERQLRTGERYTTARRRLLAERAEAPPDAVPAPEPVTMPRAEPVAVPVIELLDVSDEAARRGLRCRVAMFPSLAERAEPNSVVARLHDVLVGTVGDSSTALLCSVALMGQRPPPPRRGDRDLEALRQFLRRSRAGLGGTTEDGAMLVFHVAGRDGIVPVLCRLLRHNGSLVLMTVDSTDVELRDQLEVPLVAVQTGSAPEPSLFLIHRGRSYPVRADGLVIGCGREPTELAIGGGAGVPRHAAVIHRNGTYYLKQLESQEGIVYKGMRIDNKRIDEGDVFHIGDHELRFTYRADG